MSIRIDNDHATVRVPVTFAKKDVESEQWPVTRLKLAETAHEVLLERIDEAAEWLRK